MAHFSAALRCACIVDWQGRLIASMDGSNVERLRALVAIGELEVTACPPQCPAQPQQERQRHAGGHSA